MSDSDRLDNKTEANRATRRSIRQLIACFSLLGVCVGFFAGLSESPITATVIPLLFALLTGGAGVTLAKVDLSKPGDRARVSLAAICIASFAAACLISATYWILVRSGASVGSLIPGRAPGEGSAASVPSDLADNLDNVATALMLRRRLELLGATPPEIELALERFAALYRHRLQGQRLRDELVSLQKATHEVFQHATAVATEFRGRAGAKGADTVDEIVLALRSVDQTVSHWMKIVERGGTISPSDVRGVASAYDEGVGELAGGYDARRHLSATLAGSRLSVADIVGVHEQLVLLRGSLEYVDQIGDLLDQIDKVIELGVRDDQAVPVPALTRRPSMKR